MDVQLLVLQEARRNNALLEQNNKLLEEGMETLCEIKDQLRRACVELEMERLEAD